MCCTRPVFEVFGRSDKGLVWLGSTSTLEEAHAIILSRPRFYSLEYTIVNTLTGHRVHVDLPTSAR
jgi:hypothetical protein